jgi:hypothetical protein
MTFVSNKNGKSWKDELTCWIFERLLIGVTGELQGYFPLQAGIGSLLFVRRDPEFPNRSS